MFQKAILSYERYKKELILYKRKDDINLKDANRKIEMCKIGIDLVSKPINVKIENLGKNVNSPYWRHSPAFACRRW